MFCLKSLSCIELYGNKLTKAHYPSTSSKLQSLIWAISLCSPLRTDVFPKYKLAGDWLLHSYIFIYNMGRPWRNPGFPNDKCNSSIKCANLILTCPVLPNKEFNQLVYGETWPVMNNSTELKNCKFQ